MLAKITRGSQLTIPKEIVQRAAISKDSPYVDVAYENGVIYLRPVIVEERIAPEQFEKFKRWALKKDKGDLEFKSLKEGAAYLRKRMRKAHAA